MVETSTYDSPRKNQWPFRRTLVLDVTLDESVHQQDWKRPICVYIGRWCHRLPTLTLLDKSPSPRTASELIDEMQRYMLRSVCGSIGQSCHRNPTLTQLEESPRLHNLWPRRWSSRLGGMSVYWQTTHKRGLIYEGPKLLQVFYLVYLIN